MTLEERMDRHEESLRLAKNAMMAITKGGIGNMNAINELGKRVDTLEAQLGELDVMIMAIHETIKAVEAKVTEQ